MGSSLVRVEALESTTVVFSLVACKDETLHFLTKGIFPHYFSSVLNWNYHTRVKYGVRSEQSEQSSYYTTFHTPWGRKRFLRMPFGISSAIKILQRRMFETFGDIDGAHIIHEDMIVAGDDEADHDRIVHKVMERANEKHVKINSRKTKFKVNKVTYCGN